MDGFEKHMPRYSMYPKDPPGPSNGGVGTCIAGVRVLKIGTFEGLGYLGYDIFTYIYLPKN